MQYIYIIVYTIYHSDISSWSYVFSFRSDCPILNPGVIKLKDIFSWVSMTGCGQRVWIGYVLVLVASSFQKMRSKDIPRASLGLGKWGPTIWGPLLQCPAMARSSGTCRDSPTLVLELVSTKQLHCQYLRHTWWDISENCCFSTPFLRVNQLVTPPSSTQKENTKSSTDPRINMARPTPAAGFAPGSTNSTIFQQTVKPNLRAARPWDIPRSGSRLDQFFRIVWWFFVLEPTTSKNQRFNRSKF